MPRFFFHVRDGGRVFADEEGDELPGRDAVRAHALDSARDLILHASTDVIRSWLDCDFEVTDEAGNLVLTFPFAEAAIRY